jgi:hypothetical protein
LRVHTKDGSDALPESVNDDAITGKIEKQTLEMCAPLYGTHATVTMDNYFTTANLAINLLQRKVYCRGTIRSNRRLLPKSVLFNKSEVKALPRGTTRMAVNREHHLQAIGWIDNTAVCFISTADTAEMVSVLRHSGSERINVPAPVAVAEYNKWMGGVDKHDKLRSLFSIAKCHKMKKYYVKLLFFLVDVCLTNSWIYYSICNPAEAKNPEARANYFLSLATDLTRDDMDWAQKYQL